MASRPAVTDQTEAPASTAGADPSPSPAGPVLLTRDQFLKSGAELARELVDIPELGGSIYIQAMSGADRDAYDAQSYAYQRAGKSPLTDFRTRRVALSAVDADGRKLFTPADIAALSKIDGAILDRLDDVVVRLSRMGPDAVEEAKRDLKADPNALSGTA